MQKQIKNIVLFLGIIFSFNAFLLPCNWCLDKDKQNILESLKEENNNLSKDSALSDPASFLRFISNGNWSDLDSKENSGALSRQIDDSKPLDNSVKSKFYLEYLEKYYPKAFVITEEYMPQMCPIAAATALDEVLKMLAYKTYFYFQNRPKGFLAGEYLENIKEQLGIITRFLSYASVSNGKVVASSYMTMLFNDKNDSDGEKLIQYWRARRIMTFYDFYAFYFDYLVKLFLEGIRFRILSQASKYYTEITKVFEKLKGSAYESERNERLKIYKELLDLLKSKVSSQDKNDTSYL